ncbi:MAG TPA: 30S ribosomal protein S6 [Dehalococcoidia bacterium]|nr:30S ribosomal protein S6 [Dehalococcoidia bacterium]
MRDYELVMVVSPEVPDDSLPATVDRVQQFIQEQGGQITKLDPWGRRKLAYPIRQHLEGHYVVAQFSLDPKAVRALEGNLELAEDVLRHLVVKLED